VLQALPRRSELHRSNARGRGELNAANVDLLVVVLAPLPPPDLFVVDRYLAAAASAPAAVLLLQNKADLAASPEAEAELAAYVHAGYPLLRCSTHTGAGLDELRLHLRSNTALLVGQSGVGKSSLLRTLVPHSEARIGALMRDSAGRHTTTATTLHALPGGGELLDSPGVRDFAPALDRLEPRTLGFVEIASLDKSCRFADCRHYDEPGCLVRAAVDSGAMSARRYESYRRLRRLHADYARRMRSGGR
jgi:ribosome biogenesis GTPase